MDNTSREKLNLTTGIFMNERVSNCLPLGKETGNFWDYLENSSGNKTIESQAVTQPEKAVSLETWVETNRKPVINIGETFISKKPNKSFQSIDAFFVYTIDQWPIFSPWNTFEHKRAG